VQRSYTVVSNFGALHMHYVYNPGTLYSISQVNTLSVRDHSEKHYTTVIYSVDKNNKTSSFYLTSFLPFDQTFSLELKHDSRT